MALPGIAIGAGITIGGINTMPRWHFDNCKELKHDSRRI